MGMLLDFADAPLRREKPAGLVPATGAEVIAFPGRHIEPHTVDLGARVVSVTREQGGSQRPDA